MEPHSSTTHDHGGTSRVRQELVFRSAASNQTLLAARLQNCHRLATCDSQLFRIDGTCKLLLPSAWAGPELSLEVLQSALLFVNR